MAERYVVVRRPTTDAGWEQLCSVMLPDLAQANVFASKLSAATVYRLQLPEPEGLTVMTVATYHPGKWLLQDRQTGQGWVWVRNSWHLAVDAPPHQLGVGG